MNDPNFLAQSTHFFSAIATVMIISRFWGKTAGLIGAGIFIILAAIKEYWYDLVYELPKQSLGDSSLDFIFYLIGTSAAACILLFNKPSLK